MIAMQIARVSEKREALGFSFLFFFFLFETKSVITSHFSFLTLTTGQRHFCNKNATAKLKKVNDPVCPSFCLYCAVKYTVKYSVNRIGLLLPWLVNQHLEKVVSKVFNFIDNEQGPKSIWVLIGYWVTDILKWPKANTFTYRLKSWGWYSGIQYATHTALFDLSRFF